MRCISMSPHKFRFFSHCFRSAFQHSLALLIRYRSGTSCLDLEVDAPMFMSPTQETLLNRFAPLSYAYGTITRYGLSFQISSARIKDAPHHICPTLLQGIRHDLYGVHSLLLAASQLLSFPSPIKTLQFRE